MFLRNIAGTIWIALLAAACLQAGEQNDWPVVVRQVDPAGATTAVEYAGPLLFAAPTAGDWRGFRPFYGHVETDGKETSLFLYPFFTWQREAGFNSFSFFQLFNTSTQTPDKGDTIRHFDVWPLYFSRDTGSPDTSYRAFVPFGGTIKDRFGKDRIAFTAFPLYMRTLTAGKRTTHVLWPFFRFIDGDGYHGFEFWPLFGERGRPGDNDYRFALWPLAYRSRMNLADPQPTVSVGVLPFYTHDTGPGLDQANYLWPFFGYTHRTEPDHYDEQRYFWPFLVQGRGNQRMVNRWGPFYTHSVVKGYDKTWVLWPLVRHATWEEGGVAQEKNQFFWFVYWSLTQRSLTNPAAAPAHKTHLWPLFSDWNNGAGRHQLQILSPFEVFLPTNEPVRKLYTPLFALYRYDQPDATTWRHTWLWNAVSYRHEPGGHEFHLGPLFSSRATPAGRRVALGNGLLAWHRGPDGTRWKFSLFDFAPKPATLPGDAPSP